MNSLRLHGLMRSGTNLASWLFSHNYDVQIQTNEPDWKHGPICHSVLEEQVVLTVRHPCSWLWSAYCFGSETTDVVADFESWIFGKIPHHDRQLPELSLWSLANGYWIWRLPFVRVLRLEDMLTAPEATADTVAAELGLGRKTTEFELPEKRLGPDKRQARGTFASINKREIDERRWLHHLTQDMLDFARDNIDSALLELLGYDWPEK